MPTPSRIYYSDQAERLAKQQQVLYLVIFMAVGLGIGAILALLFAPDEGDKTRKAIASAVEDGYRRGIETASETLRQLEPEFPNIRERYNHLVGSLRR